MKTFSKFTYEEEKDGYDLSDYTSVFAAIIPENIFEKYPLTFTCYNYSSVTKGLSNKNNIDDVCKTSCIYLHSFALLINAVKAIVNERCSQVENVEIQRRENETEDLNSIVTDNSTIIPTIVRGDVNQGGIQSISFRPPPQQQEEEAEEGRENQMIDDGEEEPDENFDQTFTQYVSRLNNPRRSGGNRNGDGGVDDDVEMNGDDDDNDGEQETIEMGDDCTNENVYITKVEGFIIMFLPLYNRALSYKNICNFFKELYQSEKKRKQKKINLEAFTNGIDVKLLQSTYSKMTDILKLKNKTDTLINNPAQMFDISNAFFTLAYNGCDTLMKEMFFDPNKNYNLEQFISSLNRTKSVDFIGIPSEVYVIPISEFNYSSLTRKIMPWVEPHIVNFFTSNQLIEHNDCSQSFIQRIDKDAFPEKALKVHSDPLDYLSNYVEGIKKDRPDNLLTKDDKIKLLKTIGYVIENRKVSESYSIYDKAISSYIRERRREFGGSNRVFNIFGYVENVSKYCPEVEREDEIGPLSSFAHTSARMLKNFLTVPESYLGFTLWTPIVTCNCQDRTHGHHLHFMTIGPPESGKNYIYDVVEDLTPPFTTLPINGFSGRAMATDEPMSGGRIIQNEPPPFLTNSEKKLNITGQEKLNEFKEILSSGEFIYQYLDMKPSSDGSKKSKRTQELSITPVKICFLLSVNHVKNREEAIWTRFAYKNIFKYPNSNTMGRIIKGRATRDKNLFIYKLYHDMITIQCILNMAVSCGIIKEPTVGMGADILRKTLEDLKVEGLLKTNSPRNFDRILMVFDQLVYCSVIIKKYFQGDPTVLKKFNYEDFLDVEKDMYLTKEVLFIGTNYLGEQYINPARTSTIHTFLEKYTKIPHQDFQITQQEIQECQSYIITKNIQNSRRISRISLRPAKKKRKLNNLRAQPKNILVLKSKTSSSLPIFNPSSSIIRNVPKKKKAKKKVKVKKKKRRRTVKNRKPVKRKRNEDDNQNEESSYNFDFISKNLDDIDGETEPPKTIISDDDLDKIEDDVHSIDKKELFFELALIKLDKLLLSCFETGQKFLTQIRNRQGGNGNGGGGGGIMQYGGGSSPSSGFSGTKEYNLNCLVITKPTTPKALKEGVFYQMPIESAWDVVSNAFFDLQKPKHEIPVYFNPIDSIQYNSLKSFYYQQRMNRGRRIGFIRDMFKDNYIRNKKVQLLKMIGPSKKVRHTTILICPFLFNSIDPGIINKKLREKIECIGTKKQYIYSPKVIAFPKSDEDEDLEFIKIDKNEKMKRIVLRNPSYIDNSDIKFSFRSNVFINRQMKTASSGGTMVNINNGGNSRVNDDDDEIMSNVSEDEQIEDSQKYQKLANKFKDKRISITMDIDDYFKAERLKELSTSESSHEEDSENIMQI